MGKAKAIAGILVLFLSASIWYYLLYKVLEAVNASELMWFLYWIYLPAGIIATILGKLAEAAD